MRPRQFNWTTVAAMLAATSFCSCISVREHSQVRDQLRVEQRKAIERERRVRELDLLVERLRKTAALSGLEREEARARLAAAERLLTLKPGAGAVPAPARSEPAPAPTARSVRGTLAATIRFTAGGERLSDEDRESIAKIAGSLAERKDVRIVIEGHSDPAPIDRTHSRYRSNTHLSLMRALAVYHEFVSRPGIDPARVSVVGYGEHRPVPGTPESLRRVEVRLLPAED